MLNTILTIAVIFFCVLALLLTIAFIQDRNKLLFLRSIKLKSARQIKKNYEELRNVLPVGSFSMPAILSGIVTEERFVYAPHTKQKCVFYETVIDRLYGDGKKRETVFRDTGATDFFLYDGEDTLLVRCRTKDICEQKRSFVDKFENQIDHIPMRPIPSEQVLYGYEVKEYGVPIGERLFVLGEANDYNGVLSIAQTSRDKHAYISNTSLQEAQAELEQGIKIAQILISVLLVISVLLAYWRWF